MLKAFKATSNLSLKIRSIALYSLNTIQLQPGRIQRETNRTDREISKRERCTSGRDAHSMSTININNRASKTAS